MTTRAVKFSNDVPLLDIVSYGRRARLGRDHFSSSELDRIGRTARGAPEVMVKVSGGGKSVNAVAAHLRYVDRKGELNWETDEQEPMHGEDSSEALIAEWDLAIDEADHKRPYRGSPGRKPEKLVHNIVLSMPRGTPPARVLAASRAFAKEQFVAHRYAMVLHTDKEHPHVHLVVKARSERGGRLDIKKATLRDWRARFAGHLREHGVDANATARAVRGASRVSKRDEIFRAARRGCSSHMRARLTAAASDVPRGNAPADRGGEKIRATRRAIERGWLEIADGIDETMPDLAQDVRAFVRSMPPPMSEKEFFVAQLQQRAHAARREQALRR
jgi:Relaxase/Mobilisation nuclease domain